jgi:hypothetical protein
MLDLAKLEIDGQPLWKYHSRPFEDDQRPVVLQLTVTVMKKATTCTNIPGNFSTATKLSLKDS